MMQLSDLDIDADEPNSGPVGDNLIIGEYTASECVGVYSGNDTNNVGNNTGELDDGIPSIWPDGDFQNIDGELIANDPSWTNLARYDIENDSTTYKSMSSYDGSINLNIDEVLEFTFLS